MLNTALRLGFVLLLVSGTVALFRMAPPGSPWPAPALAALLFYGPLLLMGLMAVRLHPRSLTWLCFLLLFYFCGFVIQCFAMPPARYWGLWHTLLTTALFSLAIVAIRQRRRTS